MPRTTRDVPAGFVTPDVVRSKVGAWLEGRGFTILAKSSDGQPAKVPAMGIAATLHPRAGAMVAFCKQMGYLLVIESATATSVQGTSVHLEGYVLDAGFSLHGTERTLLASGVGIAMMPRRQGYRTFEELTDYLSELASKAKGR